MVPELTAYPVRLGLSTGLVIRKTNISGPDACEVIDVSMLMAAPGPPAEAL